MTISTFAQLTPDKTRVHYVFTHNDETQPPIPQMFSPAIVELIKDITAVNPQPGEEWLYDEQEDTYSEPAPLTSECGQCLSKLDMSFNDYVEQHVPNAVINLLSYLYRQEGITPENIAAIDGIYLWYAAVVAIYLTYKIQILNGTPLTVTVTNFADACDKDLGTVNDLSDCLALMGSITGGQ